MSLPVSRVALTGLLLALGACSTALQPAPLPPDVARHPSVTPDVGQPTLTETYWKAVELMGKPVPEGMREAHIILKQEGHRVNGSGGCNGIGSTYDLQDGGRIRFGPPMSTLMACAKGMETDHLLGQALQRADSYVIANGRLQLNRARMAPLAVFEPVYLR